MENVSYPLILGKEDKVLYSRAMDARYNDLDQLLTFVVIYRKSSDQEVKGGKFYMVLAEPKLRYKREFEIEGMPETLTGDDIKLIQSRIQYSMSFVPDDEDLNLEF